MRSPAGRAAAIRRARVLAALLLLTLVSWLGVAVALLQPVVAGAATLLLAADLVALRAVARRRQALRRQEAAAAHPAGCGRRAPSSADLPSDATGEGPPQQRTPAADARRSIARTSGAPLRRTLPPAAARWPAAHRVSRREVPAAEAGPPTSDGTWMPVPVPPPTYTLKPMAPRPEPPALDLDGKDPSGPSGPATVAASASAGETESARSRVVVGSEGVTPPTGPAPDRYEGVEPAAALERPARRPWDEDREWADELDLDAVLARRRAVNG